MSFSPFDPAQQNQNTESKIVAALERISQAFRVLLWNESKAHGLSPIQVQVLIFARYHPAEKCTVSYLADEFNMTRATMSDVVKTLEQKQLIIRVPNPNDTRSFFVELTPAGSSLVKTTAQFSNEILKPVQQLPDENREQLLENLLGIIRHLNRADIITVQRMCFNCGHYRKTAQGSGHFCALLNTPLKNSELRIDCPEHVATAD